MANPRDTTRLQAFEDIFARPTTAHVPSERRPHVYHVAPPVQYAQDVPHQNWHQHQVQEAAYNMDRLSLQQDQSYAQPYQRASMYVQHPDERQPMAGPSRLSYYEPDQTRSQTFSGPYEHYPPNANQQRLPQRRPYGSNNSIDSSLMKDPHLSAYFDHPTRAQDADQQVPNSSDYVVPSPHLDNERPTSMYSVAPSQQPQQGAWNHFTQAHPAAYYDDHRQFDDSQSSQASAQQMSYYAPRPPDGPRPLPPPPTVVVQQSQQSPNRGRPPSQDSHLTRNSSNSTRQSYTPPIGPNGQDRANSFSSTGLSPSIHGHSRRQSFPATMTPMTTPSPAPSGPPGHARTPSSTTLPGQPSAVVTASRRPPIVYPALLSKVAEAFKMRVLLAERAKDGLSYKEAFDGREAVDKIAFIIKTTDRNLALLLGRALDAQKFFHDVTYDHRLRDSPHELYQFKEKLTFVSSDDVAYTPDDVPSSAYSSRPMLNGMSSAGSSEPGSSEFGGFSELDRHASSKSMATTISTSQYSDVTADGYLPPEHFKKPPPGQRRQSATETILSDDTSLPSGIFTLLTDCYSPTCTRDQLCYSIACPRRLEQQARLKLKPRPGLKKSTSTESLGDLQEPSTLWIQSVPKEVSDEVSDAEKRRQEAINEAIYTERDFLRDVEYLRERWIGDIRSGSFIPESRKEDFIRQVFWNVLDIQQVSHRLCEQLTRRQKQAHVVSQIGDVYIDNVGNFAPFVAYGAHQLFGKVEFEREKGSNPAFAKFVEDTERLPESRKLELNAYLTKPTTRLARYPLLLEAVLKHTPEGHQDKILIPKAVKVVREFLAKVNLESGKSENRFNLAQLDSQIVFKPGEQVDLKLREEHRELITKGPLKKRGGTQSESAELQVFLFDHALVMSKQKNKLEQYKVYRKPIPLELLMVSTIDEVSSARNTVTARSRTLMTRANTGNKLSQPPSGVLQNQKGGFAMTFTHLGRKGYDITLWAATRINRKNWLDKIDARQFELRERSMVFDATVLSEEYFLGHNRVTCAAPFDAGSKLVFGTDQGVFLTDLRDKSRVPIKVISVPNVTQVDVLDDYGILIVLADRAVQTFFVDHLDPNDAIGAAKRARKISSNASFFKTGICMGRTLVCVVKSGSTSSTIKTLEPVENPRGKKQPAIRKLLQGSHDSLRVFKEFYLPNSADSIHFLKSKLCVGCSKGFEIVDLDTLDTQGLLDPADSSLDFVQKRENVRPTAIYRIEGEFLLCYDEFAFYVNKNGWRTKGHWLIQWEGRPSSFALYYPYVVAFEATFIEVRHVDSGALMQIIPGNNLKCLYIDTPSSSTMSTGPSQYLGQQNGYMPQFGRHSTYGSQVPLNFKMPPRASQIIFSDNGHQIYRLHAAAPPQ